LALLLLAAGASGAFAQGLPPPPALQNPVCTRLEGQLALVDRGGSDPARAEQVRRMEDTVNRQQAELDRTVAQSRRLGCEGLGFFSLFGGQNPQCPQLTSQIQQLRSNLDRSQTDLQRVQGATDRDSQRQPIIAALAQNNCGPQYQTAINQQRGLFGSLFGGGPNPQSPDTWQSPDSMLPSGMFRTICVRTCDGYYFPVSFQTTPARFAEDEQTCRRTCPAAEVVLYSHRNPGEDVAQAVSNTGKFYKELPTAFRYRQELNPACSCRRPGQSWAEALGQTRDTTIERGDIVVTDERAKAMSQPRDAQGRPIRPDPRNSKSGATTGPAQSGANPGTGDQDAAKRSVRTVGPTFVPAR
jgi:hypothetical protein